VLRCEPDGSNLELVHTGLRNPQDLAFDEHGNLFTGDNNSDGGDATRWVYVVEGGDSGWRVGYQWHEFPISRGPWNYERLWEVNPAVPAAYIVPPIANPKEIPGPAGLTYTGGVGLPPEWRNKFLLVDFRGGATNSGIWALTNKPKGASFELAETKKFVGNALATDVECGYDGGVYFSDWVNGWVPLGKGRIYRVIDHEAAKDPAVAEVRALLSAGLTGQTTAELVSLLAHRDMRVRMAAQFALADRKAVDSLAAVAPNAHADPLARLHAMWGLGQLGRKGVKESSARVVPLLSDIEEEVRAQAAKVLGEAAYQLAFEPILALLHDPSDRVKFFAALALAKLGHKEAVEPVFAMLRENADRDAYLRHAGIVALAALADPKLLTPRVPDVLAPEANPDTLTVNVDRPSDERLAALLALRRLRSPRVSSYLLDPDPLLELEAFRAINDVPIDDELVDLSAGTVAQRGVTRASGLANELILMRALNTTFRWNSEASPQILVKFAGNEKAPERLRVEALRMLLEWGKPAALDRVTGLCRPLPARDQAMANDAVRPALPALLRKAPDAVRAAAATLVPVVGLSDATVLVDVVRDPKLSGAARGAALTALAGQKAPVLAEAVDAALTDQDVVLRRAAIRAAAALPDGAARVRQALTGGTPLDQQAAMEAIGLLDPAAADTLLSEAADRLVAGKVAPEARLDLLSFAAARPSPTVTAKLKQYEASRPKDDDLAPFRETLAGGDRERGRKIFYDRADVQCLRCHSIKGEGGSAGPDLSGIGKRQSREYLLESVLFPAKHIAQGWETVTVRLDNGDTLAGVLKSESERELVLADPEKGEVRIDKAKVKARRGGQTAMPTDVAQTLSKHDLRDLVEFLAELK
jgi:quinoprotein glucose dehydrogenase